MLALGLVLAPAAVTGAEAQAAAGEMQVISLADWDEVLARKKPSIVVVDLWASWCVSCIERFPKMVEMAHRYPPPEVRFVTLNLDDPRDQAGIDWANEFLAQIGADFEHYHLAANLTASFEALDLNAIPVVLIYDGQGSERFRLSNDDPNRQFTEEDVERAIRSLMDAAKRHAPAD